MKTEKYNNKETTGNIGEWSELYTLGFLLSNGGIYGADKDLNKKEDVYYKILKVIFNNKNEKITYEIEKDSILIFLENKKIGKIKQSKIRAIIKKLLKELTSQNEGRVFSLISGSELMFLLKKEIIKASSKDKKDLDLILLDIKTESNTPEIGFSIKSQLGSPSTLINASTSTNFIYEILDKDGNVPKKIPKLIDKEVKDNTELLFKNNLQLSFKEIESNTFNDNLLMIDSNLPKYISEVLISFYSRRGNTLNEIIKNNKTLNKKQPIHKIKEFLSIMALGMMPNTKWNGILTSLGGFILVKKDGDVLCYYLYNISDFQEYLINNLKLDTPSTTRYGIGKIIKNKGRYYYKLNLQIRFIK